MHQVTEQEFHDAINLVSFIAPVHSETEPDFWEVFYVEGKEIGFVDTMINEFYLHGSSE